MGLRLGLLAALHEAAPLSSEALAKKAGGLAPRYVREWALAQAANGYVRNYDAANDSFCLSPEQALIFAVKDSPVFLAGAFDLVAAMIEGEPKVEKSFRTAGGVRRSSRLRRPYPVHYQG